MGRAPCCEKMGMKKGPWTLEEDQILISHVQRFGHGNWRALPKLAGLLRCGKSCRLRWVNYLRPDIKRGNFTKQEEEMVIKMHQALGNRWSIIASKLPGRTDNEIKNVWHTHLKKKLYNNTNCSSSRTIHHDHKNTVGEHLSKQVAMFKNESKLDNVFDSPILQQNSTITDLSTPTATTPTTILAASSDDCYNPEPLSDDFWSQVLSSDDINSLMPVESGFQSATMSGGFGCGEEREFWCNLMPKVEEFPNIYEM